jgi:hypothetical protein
MVARFPDKWEPEAATLEVAHKTKRTEPNSFGLRCSVADGFSPERRIRWLPPRFRAILLTHLPIGFGVFPSSRWWQLFHSSVFWRPPRSLRTAPPLLTKLAAVCPPQNNLHTVCAS